MGSAYAALTWLCGALVLGPRNVLTGRPNPVSFDLRRDMGIWAGLTALLHVVFGLQAHLRGEMWRYFFHALPNRSNPLPLRLDLFGFANITGLIAAVILLGLLTVSNDASLRRLGGTRWKALQRWSYGAFVLVALHGAAYQLSAGREPVFVLVFAGLLVPVVGLQLAAIRTRRRRRRRLEG